MKEATAKQEQEEKRKVRSKSMTQAAAAPKRTIRNVKRMMKKVTFVVLQKNTKSLNSSDKMEDIIHKVEDCKWDALLLSETWRPNNAEICESQQGPICMGAGKFENKH